jgi:hypothetical protein
MTRQVTACTMWFVLYTGVAVGATMTLSTDFCERFAVARQKAPVRVYRVSAQPFAPERLDTVAAVAGVTPGTVYSAARAGYLSASDTARAGAFHDSHAGRYVCFRESKCDFSIAADFPAGLNSRATALLGRLTSPGEQYVPTSMDAYVVQEPSRTAPWQWRRTYHFSRLLDARVVLGSEGAARVQFNRSGAASLVEVPALALAAEPVVDPVDPITLPARLEALAATMDTLMTGALSFRVKAVVARSVVSSYTTENRDEVPYLVPSLTVLLECDVEQTQPLRRQRHFSLDGRSAGYGYGDPWLSLR